MKTKEWITDWFIVIVPENDKEIINIMDKKIKRCPCGDESCKVTLNTWNREGGSFGTQQSRVSSKCGFIGPKKVGFDSENKAILAWNKGAYNEVQEI